MNTSKGKIQYPNFTKYFIITMCSNFTYTINLLQIFIQNCYLCYNISIGYLRDSFELISACDFAVFAPLSCYPQGAFQLKMVHFCCFCRFPNLPFFQCIHYFDRSICILESQEALCHDTANISITSYITSTRILLTL